MASSSLNLSSSAPSPSLYSYLHTPPLSPSNSNNSNSNNNSHTSNNNTTQSLSTNTSPIVHTKKSSYQKHLQDFNKFNSNWCPISPNINNNNNNVQTLTTTRNLKNSFNYEDLTIIGVSLNDNDEIIFRDEVFPMWTQYHSLTMCTDKSLILQKAIECLSALIGNEHRYTILKINVNTQLESIVEYHHNHINPSFTFVIPNDDHLIYRDNCRISTIISNNLHPIIYSHSSQLLRIPLISSKVVIGEIRIHSITKDCLSILCSSHLLRYLIKKITLEIEQIKYDGMIDSFVGLNCCDETIDSSGQFNQLAKYLGYYLHTKYSLVCKYISDGIGTTVSFCVDGVIHPNLTYELSTTPCGQMKNKRPLCINESLQELFPKDEWLRENNIVGYLGIPLIDINGDVVGYLAAMDTKPIDSSLINNSILLIIANKALFEMERRKFTENLIIKKEILNGLKNTSILLTNENGIIQRVFGEELFECKGKSLTCSFIDCIVQDESSHQLVSLLSKSEEIKIETICKTLGSGKVFPAEISFKLINIDRLNYHGGLFIVRDISLEKDVQKVLEDARDQALQCADLKSNAYRTISHEIRTPMNGLIGLVEILLSSNLQPDQAKIVESIYNSAEHLYSITSSILDCSKIEENRLELDLQSFDFRGCIEGVVNTLELTLKKPIEISLIIDEKIPNTLRGDPGRLRQVLYNLCHNSIKYTEKGFINIKIQPAVSGELEEAKRSTDRCLIEFIVEDSGVGIDEKNKDQLFLPFYQFENGVASRITGSGLGLSICKSLVEMMDGKIQLLSSTVGQGSKFSFTTILFIDNQQPSQQQQEPSQQQQLPQQQQQQIQEVVKKQEEQREVIASTLNDRQYNILVVNDYEFGRNLLIKKMHQYVPHRCTINSYLSSDIYNLVIQDFIPSSNGHDDPFVGVFNNIDLVILVDGDKEENQPLVDLFEIAERLTDILQGTGTRIVLASNNIDNHSKRKNGEFYLVPKPLDIAKILLILSKITSSSSLSPSVSLSSSLSGIINSNNNILNRHHHQHLHDNKHKHITNNNELPTISSPLLISSNLINHHRDDKRLKQDQIVQQHPSLTSTPPKLPTASSTSSLLPTSLSSSSLLSSSISSLSSSLNHSTTPPTPKPFNILVAEDNEVNQKVLLMQLHRLGYDNVTMASDGLEVMEKYKLGHYDLLFLDILMPLCDGLTASLGIRKYESDHSLPAIPIIALTGTESSVQDCGMNDRLLKPIKMDDLSQVLNRYLTKTNI